MSQSYGVSVQWCSATLVQHHQHIMLEGYQQREFKGKEGSIDLVLRFCIDTMLQQHQHYHDTTGMAGIVQWCPAILWDDVSALDTAVS